MTKKIRNKITNNNVQSWSDAQYVENLPKLVLENYLNTLHKLTKRYPIIAEYNAEMGEIIDDCSGYEAKFRFKQQHCQFLHKNEKNLQYLNGAFYHRRVKHSPTSDKYVASISYLRVVQPGKHAITTLNFTVPVAKRTISLLKYFDIKRGTTESHLRILTQRQAYYQLANVIKNFTKNT